jgi:predicted NBD/HSP70 family sugar kinase
MYVKVSDGIGASLILGGELYRGAGGLAGELGHTQLANGRQQCRCGRRGCLEAEVCTRSLLTQLRYTHPTVDIPTLVDLPLDDVTARVFDEAGRTVGRVLSDMCNLVNPSVLVIGGRLGTAHPAFLAGVRAAVDQFALSSVAGAVEVMAAELEDRSELRGAIHLAFETATA